MIRIERICDWHRTGSWPMFRVTPSPWLCKRGWMYGPLTYSRRSAVLSWLSCCLDIYDMTRATKARH